MEKKSDKMSLFTMLILFSLLPLVLSITFVSVTSLLLTRSSLLNEAKETLYIAANNLSNHCNQNKISYATSDTYHDYLDSLRNHNIEMAIILNNAPAVASIRNNNDFRIREIPINEELLNASSSSDEGFYDNHVVIDDKIYCGYYMPISVNDEMVGYAFAGELQREVTGAIKSIVFAFVGVAVIFCVLFAAITTFISRRLTLSFRLINKNIDELSKGNLAHQGRFSHMIKEMNKLMLATGIMQGNLSETIGKVKGVSDKLVTSISEVTALSESSSEGAGSIAYSIQELSKSVSIMDENVQNINIQMQEIGNCINEISGNVEQLYNHSDSILQVKEDAEVHINSIMESSSGSVRAVNEIAVQIEETNNSIRDIDQAIELIIAIAEQTNLLSLNATIEAARAGSMGKGFAVIADEIRSLASQSSDGAEMVKNVAGKINEKSRKSVELVKEVHTLIQNEQEGISVTQRKFEELSEQINQSVSEIKSISGKTEKLNEYKKMVLDKVCELSAISEENAAGNENVSLNIDKINLDVHTVNENCEKMNDMAKELIKSIEYFYGHE